MTVYRIYLVCLSILVSCSDIKSGIEAYEAESYASAHKEFENVLNHFSTDRDEVIAQRYFGLMYANGLGVVQDYKKAASYTATAAEQGDTQTQYNLGVLYEHGLGLEQSDNLAVKWYLIAQNKATAMLATLLMTCIEMPEEYLTIIGSFITGVVSMRKPVTQLHNFI
ncbi:MAG: tetratricopeptide repeat protein [Nitrososphaerales archaeon]